MTASQTVGISWVNNASEATSYSWLENLATYNSGGYCPQTHGNSNQANVTTYLNSVSPWGYLGRMILRDDGSVSSKCNVGTTPLQTGDSCYDDSAAGVVANGGQAMWYMPAFYYYTNHTPGSDDTYRWYISPTGAATDTVGGNTVTWKRHPAFSRNSITKPWIALGTYEGHYNTDTSKLESYAAVAPTVSKTLPQFRTAAAARGTGWGIQDYLSTTAVQLCYLIEYGGFNSQTLLGNGITTGSVQNTGGTITYGNASYGTAANTTTAISFRGLENIWGNYDTFVDGISIKAGYHPWVADNGFVCDTFASPYVDTGFTMPSTDNYIADINASATYDYGFLPLTVQAGGSAKQLCDYYYHAANNQVICIGGSVSTGASVFPGFFYMQTTYGSGTSNTHTTSRLMYIP